MRRYGPALIFTVLLLVAVETAWANSIMVYEEVNERMKEIAVVVGTFVGSTFIAVAAVVLGRKLLPPMIESDLAAGSSEKQGTGAGGQSA